MFGHRIEQPQQQQKNQLGPKSKLAQTRHTEKRLAFQMWIILIYKRLGAVLQKCCSSRKRSVTSLSASRYSLFFLPWSSLFYFSCCFSSARSTAKMMQEGIIQQVTKQLWPHSHPGHGLGQNSTFLSETNQNHTGTVFGLCSVCGRIWRINLYRFIKWFYTQINNDLFLCPKVRIVIDFSRSLSCRKNDRSSVTIISSKY